MKTLLFAFLTFLLSISSRVIHAQDMQGTTDSGRRVVLKGDGTWKFIEESKLVGSEPVVSYTKPGASTSVCPTRAEKVVVWYDVAKWKQQEVVDPVKVTFQHKDGDVYALVIAERISMTIDALRDLAVSNAQKAAPDAKVTLEERRIVNDKTVLCMQIQGTIQGIQFVYYGYYYAGTAGTIQLLTYTSSNLFSEYESDMAGFLNGLVISE